MMYLALSLPKDEPALRQFRTTAVPQGTRKGTVHVK